LSARADIAPVEGEKEGLRIPPASSLVWCLLAVIVLGVLGPWMAETTGLSMRWPEAWGIPLQT